MTSLLSILLALSAAASPALAQQMPQRGFDAVPTGQHEQKFASALPADPVYFYDGPTKTAQPTGGYSSESPAAGNGGAKYTYENVKNKDGTTGGKKECVLRPAVDYNTDVLSLDEIIPNKNLKVFWSEDSKEARANDPNVAKRVAQANYEMKYKAVNLGQSARIKKVYCKPKDEKEDSMFVEFQDKGAFDCAKNHWQEARMAKDEELLLGGYYEGCGGQHYKDGERTWSLVNDLIFDDATMTITCDVRNVALDEAVEKGDISFGSYEPFKKSDAKGTPTYDYGQWGAEFDSDLDNQMQFHVVKDPYAAMITKAPQFDKRWSWNPIENIKSAVKKVTSFVKKEVAVATSVVKALNPLGTHTFGLPSLNPSIKIGPGKDETLWGEKGNYIGDFENIRLYCVGCRFHGKMNFGGKIKFAIPDLVKGKVEGTIDFSGSLDIQLALGLYADLPPTVKIPIELANKNIFTQGIPQISIPGVVTIGPYVSLDFNVVAGLMFNGRLMTGFKIHYPHVEAHANLGDKSKSYSKGFDNHQIGPILKADGNFTASLSFGLPLSINFGINFFNGKFEFSAKLIQRPSIQFSASQELHIDQDEKGNLNRTSWGGSGTCSGTNLGISIQVDWLLNLFDLFSMNLYHIPFWRKDWCWTGGLFINDEQNGTGLKLGKIEGVVASDERMGKAWVGRRGLGDGSKPHGGLGDGPKPHGGLGDGPQPHGAQKRAAFDIERLPDYEVINRIPDTIISAMERRRRRRSPQDEAAAAVDPVFAQYKSRTLRLVSADGLFVLVSKRNGNIYALPIAQEASAAAGTITQWISYDDVVATDSTGRAFYVHRKEFERLGVSRLRLAEKVEGGVSVPPDAENVSLLAAPGVMPQTYIGASFMDDVSDDVTIMFPLVCLYKDDKQPAKIFGVNEIKKGLAVLGDPENRNNLTGGIIDTCMLMHFSPAAAAA